MLLRLFKYASPSVLVVLGLMLTGFSLARRFFFSTPLGLLFLALIAYFCVGIFTEIEPLSFGEFIVWVDSLDSEASGIFWTSLLAFLGIFGGLSTGAWILRTQRRDSYREKAVAELSEVLTKIKFRILEVDAAANNVLRCLTKLNESENEAESEFWVKKLLQNYNLTISEQTELSKLHQELSFIFNLHSLAIDSEYLLSGLRETINKAINRISDECFFVVPEINPSEKSQRNFLIENGEWDNCTSLQKLVLKMGQ